MLKGWFPTDMLEKMIGTFQKLLLVYLKDPIISIITNIYESFLLEWQETRTSFRLSLYDVEEEERRYKETISLIRKFFFTKRIPRYNDDIFFMTPFFHLIFASKLQRAIFLDADLQFRADIADLWAKFAEFTKDNLIGIAWV